MNLPVVQLAQVGCPVREFVVPAVKTAEEEVQISRNESAIPIQFALQKKQNKYTYVHMVNKMVYLFHLAWTQLDKGRNLQRHSWLLVSCHKILQHMKRMNPRRELDPTDCSNTQLGT